MIGNLEIGLWTQLGSIEDNLAGYIQIAQTIGTYIQYDGVTLKPTIDSPFIMQGSIDLIEVKRKLDVFLKERGYNRLTEGREKPVLWLSGNIMFKKHSDGSDIQLPFGVRICQDKIIISTFREEDTENFLTASEDANPYVLSNLKKFEEIAEYLVKELKPDALVVGENISSGPSMVYWIEYHKSHVTFLKNIEERFVDDASDTRDTLQNYLNKHDRLTDEAKKVLGKKSKKTILDSLKRDVPQEEIKTLLKEVTAKYPTSEFREEDGYIYFKSSRTLPFTIDEKPPNYLDNASLDFYCSLFLKMISEKTTARGAAKTRHIKVIGAEKVTEASTATEIIKAIEEGPSMFDPIAERWRIKIDNGLEPKKGFIGFIKDIESEVNEEIDEQLQEDAEARINELKKEIEMINEQFKTNLKIKNA